MDSGSAYIVMVLVAFAAFTVALAGASWWTSKA